MHLTEKLDSILFFSRIGVTKQSHGGVYRDTKKALKRKTANK